MKLQKGDYIKLEGVSDETLADVRDAFVRAGFNEYEGLNLRSDYECYGIDRDGDCIFHDKSCRYSKSSRLLTPEQVINWDKVEGRWIEWSGGECPVADGVKVDIRFRNGDEIESLNGFLSRWNHIGSGVDIIAYRICEQELSPEDAQAEDEEFARIAKESIVTKHDDHITETFHPLTDVEKDPNGIDQHAKGSKLDAGKVRLDLVLGGFSKALMAVGEVGTFGANKYTDDGWMEVPDGISRYSDALLRHYMKEKSGEINDPDSNLSHAAHLAWNALARLEKMLTD